MKLSRYKRKMLKGFITSLVAVTIGSLILKYFSFPVFGVPLVLGGGFSAFFFLIYMIGEYEEDDADARTISEIAIGHVQGFEIRSKKRPK